MSRLHDTIRPQFIRLSKPDGHLGALYDVRRGVLRLIGRNGQTVDYDLVALSAEAAQQESAGTVEVR